MVVSSAGRRLVSSHRIVLTASIGDRARRAGRYSWAACAPAAAPRPAAAAGRSGSTAAGTSRTRRICARAALRSGRAVPVQGTHGFVPGLVACEHTVSNAMDHFMRRDLVDASGSRHTALLLESAALPFERSAAARTHPGSGRRRIALVCESRCIHAGTCPPGEPSPQRRGGCPQEAHELRRHMGTSH